MSARDQRPGASGTDPIALMDPAVRAVVERTMVDPAVDTVSTDGASVWVTGRPANGRTDVLRRVLPPTEEGGSQ